MAASDEDIAIASRTSGDVFRRPDGKLMCYGRCRHASRRLLNHFIFKAASIFSLLTALFLGPLANVLNFPDDPSIQIVDIICIIISVFFMAEIIVAVLGHKRYYTRFFFWMDLVGTISMAFEISFLLGDQGKMNSVASSVDSVLMRTARAAKIAARAGRLVKLTKLLSMFHRGRDPQYQVEGERKAEAISKKLIRVMSTKVSMLTIALVLLLPLFNIGVYPEQDFSMAAWVDTLEEDYAKAANTATLVANHSSLRFEHTVKRLITFYKDKTYRPYTMKGYFLTLDVNGTLVSLPGALILDRPEPNRKQNVYERKALISCQVARHQCSDAALYFDLTGPGQLTSGMDALLIVFVIVVMIGVSINVTTAVSGIVVAPMEKMLSVVREHAVRFISTFDKMDEEDEAVDEIVLLETVFKKLAKLYGIVMAENVVDETKLWKMDDLDKGVLVDMMGLGLKDHNIMDHMTSQVDLDVHEIAPLQGGITEALFHSWDLDFLVLDQQVRESTALHIFMDSHLGRMAVRPVVSVPVFQSFLKMALSGYTDQSYHNSIHACDVLHTTFRLVAECRCEEWVSNFEIYGLLLAALCHDIGHQGRTNQFLVETHHDWAITFNDLSPLENMHCSSLFNICKDKACDVFGNLNDEDYKKARKVCIQAILHTDLVKHFEMVKDLKTAHEVASEVIDKEIREGSQGLFGIHHLSDAYANEVLRKNLLKYLELFLHFADVSNPLKPFDICKAWAWRVLDEFFAQGDEEKKLGIPVGMLNDRDTVSRPGSQHGFISFLVAPLVFGAVDIFPQLRQLSMQMALNMEEWRNIWVQEAKPDSEEITKKDGDVRAKKEKAQEQFDRIITFARV